MFHIRTHGWRKWHTTALTSTIGSEKFKKFKYSGDTKQTLAMFDWSDTVFRQRNVTRRRISNTVLQPRYWGSEADSPEVCRLTKQSLLESTSEIRQNKHVKVLHYYVNDIKWLKWYFKVNFIDVLVLTEWKYTRKIGVIYFRFTKIETSNFYSF
jgi:hypothetical protein